MINDNENETGNKKIDQIDTTQIGLGLDMDMCLSIMMVICIKQHLSNI